MAGFVRVSALIVLLGGCVIVSFLLNLISMLYLDIGLTDNETSGLTGKSTNSGIKNVPTSVSASPKRRLAQLECKDLSNANSSQRMVYWSDIQPYAHLPEDEGETSDEKFILFDEDVAGWNNKRISFEIFAILAKTTNRTLVLPPIGGEWFGLFLFQQNTATFSFSDVLHLKGVRIISMENFLQKEQLNFRYGNQSRAALPQGKIDWTSQPIHELRNWMKEVTHLLDWSAEECLLAIPEKQGNTQSLNRALESVVQQTFPRDQWDKPLDLRTASLEDRLSQLVVFKQTKLCFYDENLSSQKYLYYQIGTEGPMSMKFTARLMIWFYQFIFMEDWHRDLEMKRWIRDSVRYSDELQCIAAQIVNQLPQKFHSLHVRRSSAFEHQFGKQPSAQRIYLTIKGLVEEGSSLYIATDEPNQEFFRPLMEHYRVFFIGNFVGAVSNLPSKYYGMIDQLVAAQGDLFFGSWSSTFTGFIIRMRGYLSQISRKPNDGVLHNTFFYNQKGKFRAMHTYQTPRQAWFLRESPIAWHDIDRDLY